MVLYLRKFLSVGIVAYADQTYRALYGKTLGSNPPIMEAWAEGAFLAAEAMLDDAMLDLDPSLPGESEEILLRVLQPDAPEAVVQVSYSISIDDQVLHFIIHHSYSL